MSPSEALGWLVPGYFGWHDPTYHGAMRDCFTSEYFGLLPWALAAGALTSLWATEAWVRRLTVLALLSFFLAQRQWTPFYFLFRHMPVLSGFRIWSRILFLLTFALCGLAAFGWDALLSDSGKAGARHGAALYCALAALVSALALTHIFD
ncbi:MAG: hypothetical protein ACREKE_00365, partial [bacterium]